MQPFHRVEQHAQNYQKLIDTDQGISKENRRLIKQFMNHKMSEGVSFAHIAKLLSSFRSIMKHNTPRTFSLKHTTEKQLRTTITNIERGPYAEGTKHAFKVTLKLFYKWLYKGKVPARVAFIKTSIRKERQKLPEDLLTKNEVERIIAACRNNRDKALIALLYESGARIGEIGALKIKHLQFDKHGVVCTIPSGKTGARRIRLVACERYLRNWLLDHPQRTNSESWLWTTFAPNGNERMNYYTMRSVILKKSTDAGVKTFTSPTGARRTKVHPHLFRHSRATELANILTEQQMKVYLGWTQSSDMASIYVHLSGKDVDGAILRAHGITMEKAPAQAIRCQSCGRENPAGTDICHTCFRPLTIKAAAKAQKHSNAMAELVEFCEDNNIDMKKVMLRLAASSKHK